MSYIPNGLADRLQWVARTHERRPVVAFTVAYIALWATGNDEQARLWQQPSVLRRREDSWYTERYQGLEHGADDYDDEGMGTVYVPIDNEAVREILAYVPKERTAFDRVVPWVTAQIAAAAKTVDRERKARLEGRKTPGRGLHRLVSEYENLTSWMGAKGAALAMWAERERPDLNRMSVDEVAAALEEFEFEVADVPQGDVVYRFWDGWTIQQLGSDALKVEGELMQHCVGQYCEQVEEGRTEILSLRDPRGRPHVTIEYDPHEKAFQQIMGKQNDEPKPEYRQRVEEWLRTLGVDAWFDGMIELGHADFSEENLSDLQIVNRGMSDVRFNDADLWRASLLHVHLSRCSFSGASMGSVQLINSWALQCTFAEAELTRLRATKTQFSDTVFLDANLQDAKFVECDLAGCDFKGADVRRAVFYNCDFGTMRASLHSFGGTQARRWTSLPPYFDRDARVQFSPDAHGKALADGYARVFDHLLDEGPT